MHMYLNALSWQTNKMLCVIEQLQEVIYLIFNCLFLGVTICL